MIAPSKVFGSLLEVGCSRHDLGIRHLVKIGRGQESFALSPQGLSVAFEGDLNKAVSLAEQEPRGVFVVVVDGEEARIDAGALNDHIESVCKRDAVDVSAFFSFVILFSKGSRVCRASRLSSRVAEVRADHIDECLRYSGPTILVGDTIWAALKLHEDFNGASMVAGQADSSGDHHNLGICWPLYQTLSVAVPSCAPALFHPTSADRHLQGIRFAVKDIFAVQGLRISLCSRSYYTVAETQTRTSSLIQKLQDEGASLLGMLKLSSFIGREEPMEAIDYQTPFNPRGDGYQSPAGSSSGSGAAIASNRKWQAPYSRQWLLCPSPNQGHPA